MEAARDLEIWMQRLRDSATAFVEADDLIKKSAKKLKPYRSAVKENRDTVVQLLSSRQQGYCDVPSHDCTLKLSTRKAKKAPNRDAVRERCKQWEVRAGKSDRSGDELFTYLFKPDVVETTGLRRAKLQAPAAESESESEPEEEDAEE